MKLLPSHFEDLKRAIAKKQMREADFTIDADGPTIFFESRGRQYRFKVVETTNEKYTIGQTFDVLLNPGPQHTEERKYTKGWHDATDGMHRLDSILDLFHKWLDYVRREVIASGGGGDGSPPPEWVTSPELASLQGQIAKLNSQAARLEQRLAVLWQTGDVLNEAVRAMFHDIGFGAQHTTTGSTYDLSIPLSSGRRLLAEITGIEGNLKKGRGGKIAQIVDAYNGAEKGDRVVVIVNAYRKLSPATRTGPVASEDALRVITALDAVLMSTSTLYGIWEQSLADAAAARARVEELAVCAAGVFK